MKDSVHCGSFRGLLRRFVAPLLLLSVLGLPACTTVKLGYEKLPWLLAWQADRFLDLDGEQERLVDRHLVSLQAWHRRSQLPVYAAFVARIEEEIRSPLAADRPAGWRRELLAQWPPIAERAAPMVAEVALTLQPRQLEHLRKAFARANDKALADDRPADPDERLARRVKGLTERAEGFLGPLDAGQQARVAQAARASDAYEERWWAERLARQRRVTDFLAGVIRNRPDLPAATEAARRLLLDLADPATIVVAPESDRLTVELLAAASPEQLARARRRVAQYRGDFETLARR